MAWPVLTVCPPSLEWPSGHLYHLCMEALKRVKEKSEQPTQLTLYLIETPLNTFANRADPDQAAA